METSKSAFSVNITDDASDALSQLLSPSLIIGHGVGAWHIRMLRIPVDKRFVRPSDLHFVFPFREHSYCILD